MGVSLELAFVAMTCTFGSAPVPAPRPESLVERDRLLTHVRDLPTKRSPWSSPEHEAGLREAEKQIEDKLRAMGYAPTLEPIDHLGARTRDGDKPDDVRPDQPQRTPWHNIIVELPGRGAVGEWLIVGAHIDAVPQSPGADDNATGVACLLEAARVLKGAPMQRSVRLIFFNLEEVGLVGARAHAQRVRPAHEDGSARIVGMISVEMIGYYSDKPGSQESPIPPSRMFKPPTVGDFVGMAGLLRFRTFSQALDAAMRAAEPRVKTAVVDFLPVAPRDLMRSDHAPFWAIGAPAVMLTDTANFRNPNYHKPTDTIDTLDAERFTIAARAIVGAVHRLAGPQGEALVPLAPPGPAPSGPDAPAKSEPQSSP